jgi:hypothetical protein
VHPGIGAFLRLHTVVGKMRVPDDPPAHGVHDEDHRPGEEAKCQLERVSSPKPMAISTATMAAAVSTVSTG